jgi:hypothetical protein
MEADHYVATFIENNMTKPDVTAAVQPIHGPFRIKVVLIHITNYTCDFTYHMTRRLAKLTEISGVPQNYIVK